LRPPYSAIDHNWSLVQDALLVRSRAEPEQLAERALPILVDLALARDAVARPSRRVGAWVPAHEQTAVHLIGRVQAGDDDDGEWLLNRLANLFSADSAWLWAVDGDGREHLGARRVHRIDAGSGTVPRGGTHVYAGIDFDCSGWIDRADADRVIVFCQSAAPTHYLDQLRALARDGSRPVDLVFPSEAMAERFGQGHAVLPPLVDLPTLAMPASAEGVAYDEWLIEPPPAWPVGVVGRNRPYPCEPTDGDLISGLGVIAGRVHLYDPGRFRYLLGADPAIRFFARQPHGLPAFLAQLRCYVQRSSVWWQESTGRELYGAMALGIPVLCPRMSIHAERIAHGVDGFLYETTEEALKQVTDLRRAPALAVAVGRAARAKMLALTDREAQARRYRELILGRSPAATVPGLAVKVA
jgi:hypothetical protein